jgi:hypothetical protein
MAGTSGCERIFVVSAAENGGNKARGSGSVLGAYVNEKVTCGSFIPSRIMIEQSKNYEFWVQLDLDDGRAVGRNPKQVGWIRGPRNSAAS